MMNPLKRHWKTEILRHGWTSGGKSSEQKRFDMLTEGTRRREARILEEAAEAMSLDAVRDTVRRQRNQEEGMAEAE